MYGDTPEENGNADIRLYYQGQPGLFLEFTEDNYIERVYLMVQISDDFKAMLIINDYGRAGTTLYLQ